MKKYELERDTSDAKVVRVILWRGGKRARETVRGPLVSVQHTNVSQEIIGAKGELSPQEALAEAERLAAQYSIPVSERRSRSSARQAVSWLCAYLRRGIMFPWAADLSTPGKQHHGERLHRSASERSAAREPRRGLRVRGPCGPCAANIQDAARGNRLGAQPGSSFSPL